jgi:hypothetical protein
MGPDRRHRFGHPGLRLLPLLLPPLLGGCSGTRFGEALSRSFPGVGEPPPAATSPAPDRAAPPAATPLPGAAAAVGATPGGPAAGGVAAAGKLATPPTAGPIGAGSPPRPTGSAPSAPPAAAAGQSRPRAASANPSPYRVTIRLPLADPSAPAEVVTEALRAAGVPFEVETIERIGGSAASPPASAPAPVSPAPAAPQVRPAPPPR